MVETLTNYSGSKSLIPRKALFGNPDRVSPQLSPAICVPHSAMETFKHREGYAGTNPLSPYPLRPIPPGGA